MRKTPAPSSPEASRAVIVNPPLDFELKDLDPDHPYLRERGFLPETISQFGLGYCNRGMMRGRVVIPLHDQEARLIGYAGRLVDDRAVSEENPKYLLPGRREREGKVMEFRKSLFLYQGFSLKQPVNDLVVVEGFASVWWLWQWGYRAAVALMGSDCSHEQAKLIVRSVVAAGCVWVFPDADDGGAACARSVLEKVAPHRRVRWVKTAEGQPTDCAPADLQKILWVV